MAEEYVLTEQGEVQVTSTPDQTEEAPVTSEESPTTEAAEEGQAEVQPEAKPAFYTDEEAAEILDHGGTLDSNRLTPQQKLIQKSFERGFTPKFQEVSRLREQYEQSLRQIQEQQAAQSDPKEKMYREFKQNPIKFVQEINQAIENLEMVDPMAEDYRTSRQQIAKLRGLKDEFDARRYQETSEESNYGSIHTQVYADIAESIPNFTQVKENLTQFAYSQLGLTPNDLVLYTNPVELARRGFDPTSAARFTKAVHKVYQILNAGKTAEAKVDRTPPKTVSAGTPGTPTSDTVTYHKAFEKAMKTGDWTEVYKMKGAL